MAQSRSERNFAAARKRVRLKNQRANDRALRKAFRDTAPAGARRLTGKGSLGSGGGGG